MRHNQLYQWINDTYELFVIRSLHNQKFPSNSLPTVSFLILYHCWHAFYIFCLDMYTNQSSILAESCFIMNHAKLINIPFRQPYTSALRQVCPLYVFGWKRMNRELNAVSVPLLYLCPCYLKKPETKKWKMDFKPRVYSISERDSEEYKPAG